MKGPLRLRRRAFAAWALTALLALSVFDLAGMISPGLAAGQVAPAARGPVTIAPEVLRATANGASAPIVILLAEQADLSSAYNMRDQDARGWFVYNTLRDTAARTQGPLQAFLRAQGRTYQSFWVANVIMTTGDRALIDALAARDDVRAIESNAPFAGISDPVRAPQGESTAPAVPGAVEWGVANVNAPAVWALGYTGQGIVIANQDTGMLWDHAALKGHYRGWNGTTADHNYNWHDSVHSGGGICGANSPFPCDDDGHGTHTTGTVIGDDGGGNQIGVAPGAKWIGCRNMDQGNGTPATYTECFQFFIAPYDLNGQNPDPARRPHVMNNSWGCPTSEGCAATTLQTIVESTEASGIFVEASAGNSGSSCSSVSDPPAIYSAAFSTGAYNSSNTLASFSSRGPVTVDGSNRRKPDISAPGVNVRSAYYSGTTSYASLSGTSMAGPHVVGVVALLWSARPDLVRQIAATKALLEQTANPTVLVTTGATSCGGIPYTTIPNNHFGYGRIDALAAVNGAATPTPTVTGTPPTATATATAVPPTATHTAVPPTVTVPPATATALPATATETPTGVAATTTPAPPTVTPPAGATATPTAPAATATPVNCPLPFTDVDSFNPFYQYIQCLYCRGIISGYSDNTFRWGVDVTRGQVSKIIANSAGLNAAVSGQTFTDVPASNPFYVYIERLAATGAISGYDTAANCPSGVPCFRWELPVTRGQLAKIDANAAGYNETPSGQTFADVPAANPFYVFIERLSLHGVISGYTCGGPGEPCPGVYYRPNANITRGQVSKVASQTFFPLNCAPSQAALRNP
ncbi:MAG TPA: S8 family serine peptidase [Chloroflexia bacterium]|nr:S8 family serine peptidase [Chloroflexia bacterium]